MTIAILSHPYCLLHQMGDIHPESPERIRAIDRALKNASFHDQLRFYEAREATRSELIAVHNEHYVDYIFENSPQSGFFVIDPDTVMNPMTLSASLRAAGAATMAVDLIMKREVNQAFCNVRPPGHHAERAQAMGFCFFNNVAVGVQYAMQHHHINKIAIIDFDVHHGNGTEDIFARNAHVLLCSSYQFPFYPNSPIDNSNPHVLHLPLPSGTIGKTWRAAIKSEWFEKISLFSPELLFFSAGFDAHEIDPLAGLKLVADDYYWITHEIFKRVRDSTEGRVISCLEGGYATGILGECVVAHLSAFY